MYFEKNGGALFEDLARYGVKMPKYHEVAHAEKEHITHQAWGIFYNYTQAAGIHTWVPTPDEMDWLSAKYPNTFDKYYRPRLEWLREGEEAGERWANNGLPMLCQTCQIPMAFTEMSDPTRIASRESTYHGMKYHFCSDGCKDVFDAEPEKLKQAWLPVHQIFQGNCFRPEADPTQPGFNPLAEVLAWYQLSPDDGGEFNTSADRANWERWTGRSHQPA
mgnify:FL=1